MKETIDSKKLRSFGLTVGGIFGLFGLWPLLWRHPDPRWWALIVAAVLIIPGLILPRSLRPLYRAWMAFGHALGWVNTRVILGIFFYLMVTPYGVIRRLGKAKSVHLKFEPAYDSYRVKKSLRDASHMRHQY